tara:strand:+ start:994 stop:1560 length:567 start_codon:yes stop_codon:yes gene_type:complete
MDLKDYIVTYDDVLDVNTCKNAIEFFNEDHDAVTRYDAEMCGFSCLNLTEEVEVKKSPKWNPVNQQVVLAIKKCGERYMKDVDCERYWPRQNSLEQIKVNKYQYKTSDRFDRHIDVGDHNSARRFLTYVIYLNDIEEGGATYFNDLDLEIPAKCGRVLMFPSVWTFPHSYIAPKTEDKYAISTYLHYT